MINPHPASRRRSAAPPPTGLWLVVGALGAGPAVTYFVAASTASTCGAEGDPFSCTLGAAMGIGLIGFVFAVLATIAGFSGLVDDLHHAPHVRAGADRLGVLGMVGIAVALAGVAVIGAGVMAHGTAELLLYVAGVHLVLVGLAVRLRDACVRRWATAVRAMSGRERREDHPHQIVAEHGWFQHRSRR